MPHFTLIDADGPRFDSGKHGLNVARLLWRTAEPDLKPEQLLTQRGLLLPTVYKMGIVGPGQVLKFDIKQST
jgi:hypothetical protein